ncbi:hypothetical protein GKZ68_06265 [Hymenobacter sp. BRD128]|uniref:hypothetical protein n=1 Tax=Hymenobacter sp. BRD128 TaxID=2675878 RepID=UPI0015673D25|nr:hypothetical protein [Hymenobacter sp. BRD128]QKG56278.1 hypothetical protein GKZ68_06265 [Hymenobacter sp. BRD128]
MGSNTIIINNVGIFEPKSPSSEMMHYGVAKTAQLAASRGLAELTKGINVTVTSLLPGPAASEDAEGFGEKLAGEGKTREETEHEFFRDARPSSLLQRFITVEKTASTAAY